MPYQFDFKRSAHDKVVPREIQAIREQAGYLNNIDSQIFLFLPAQQILVRTVTGEFRA